MSLKAAAEKVAAACCAEIVVRESVCAGVTLRFGRRETTIRAQLDGPVRLLVRETGGGVIVAVGAGGEVTPLATARWWTSRLMNWPACWLHEEDMNVAYINPFIRAASNVFSTMVKMPATLGKPYLRNADQCVRRKCGISVSIGLSGTVSGMVVLSMSEAAALAMASGLTGSPLGRLDADCYDAVAEIANMIAGGAKQHLPGGLTSLSLPKLTPTRDVAYPRGPVVAIPFESGVGPFVIEVALREAA